MVLGIPKLFFQFNESANDNGRDQYNSTDLDDNTIGEDTITSDGTKNTRSILRRRYGGRGMKKNTERNVTWSNTYDTYDENGGGVNSHTFETLDTFETRDDNDVDEYESHTFETWDTLETRDENEYERDRETENLIRNFNYLYPGETEMSYGQTETFDTLRSVSVSSEMDGTVEIQPLQSKPMRPVTPSPRSLNSPPPLPPQTMAPKSAERKEPRMGANFMRLLPPEQKNMNLACSSTLSEGTIEARKDRYEGLSRAESDDTYNWTTRRFKANQRQANTEATPTKTSDVFIPFQADHFPDNVIHILSSHSGSKSDDDITLDSIIDDIYDDTPTKQYDMNHIRAASDDESIVSLTKRNHNLSSLFESQKQADTIAGHIGLILPFFDKVKSDTESMAKDMMSKVTASQDRNSDSSDEKPQKNNMVDMKTLVESVVKSDVSNYASDENNNLPTNCGDAPSNDSDESYELSEYDAPIKGEVIRIQDLGTTKHGWARHKNALSTHNDDQMTVGAPDQNRSKINQGKRSLWGWKKKCKNTNSTPISDRFQPTLSPQEIVDDDDDLSCSGSCVTTESILSELKVIETTAMRMYQQLCASTSECVDTPPDYISALFSPDATELILECGEKEEREGTVEINKRGRKVRELLKKCIPKKKLSCGPVCGVSATWDPKNKDDAYSV
ncbi:hypothetical protein ACHAWU_001201 [Discostella pseudostelligera]|uniref:Uncharacterized protein n=1 Tax=Discostella pseudostelligera TaxID=259834 RepID=A0ABD3M5F8_9STRA